MWFSRVGDGGPDWRILAGAALLVTAAAHFLFGASWQRTVVLFLNIEGTAVLASSISPSPALHRTWREWFNPSVSGPAAFVAPLFWAGLVMLALGAFLGAVIG